MRKSYLDNVRWVTVVLVVIYHVIYMYNGEGISGVVGKITDLPVQYYDVYMYMAYPWFMAELFIVAGACSRYYLDSHSDREFIRRRTTKLLVPCTVGLVVFQFVQGYVNVAIGGGFDSMSGVPAVGKFLIMIVSGTGVLWFIQLLWLFSMALVLIRKIDKDRLWNVGAKAGIPVILLMAVPVWASAQVLNTPIISVYRFGLYFFVFLLGYFVFSHDCVIEKLKKWFFMFLALAVLFGAAFCAVYFGDNYADAPVNRTPLFMGFCWFGSLAMTGGMARYGNVSNDFTRWMCNRNFGLYIFHYLCISLVGLYIGKPGLLSAPAVYALSLFAGFVGGYALNAVVSRIPFLRWAVLGIKSKVASETMPDGKTLSAEKNEPSEIALPAENNEPGGETRAAVENLPGEETRAETN